MKKKGFTIIELVVVIAIIAVLAGIVLVNIISYQVKAKNAAIEEQVGSLPIAAASDVADNGGLTDAEGNSLCYQSDVINIINKIDDITNISPTCNTDSSNNWCFCSSIFKLFSSGNYSYCVDSTGFRGEINDICTKYCVNGDPSLITCGE